MNKAIAILNNFSVKSFFLEGEAFPINPPSYAKVV